MNRWRKKEPETTCIWCEFPADGKGNWYRTMWDWKPSTGLRNPLPEGEMPGSVALPPVQRGCLVSYSPGSVIGFAGTKPGRGRVIRPTMSPARPMSS